MNMDITHRDFMIAEVVKIEAQIDETEKHIISLKGQLKEALKIKKIMQLEIPSDLRSKSNKGGINENITDNK